MRFQSITYPDISNGKGCRVVLWIQGCSHHCQGCHNPETWDFCKGREFTEEYKNKLISIINLPYIQGITLSGGDPLDSFDDVYNLLLEVKEKCKDKDVWLYTGYTLEEIQNSEKQKILPMVNVLVDGLYKEKQRDVTLAFRGSSNQTIWENHNGEFVKSSLN